MLDKLSNNQWPIILGAGLYTTCRVERVFVAIRSNASFLSCGLNVKNIYHFLEQCRNSNNVWFRALMQSRLFIFVLILFFEHCNRILLCD